MTIAVGQTLRYLGPYDVCGGWDAHPYGGKIGTVVEVVPSRPAPQGPITVEFPDGFRVTATESEVKDPSLPH